MHSICVFCGSSSGRNPVYAAAAQSLGTVFAEQGIGLVYGGGRVGLMGILADAVLAAGGRVVGVIPQALALREVAHAQLTELHIVESMHERKALMADLSDGFIALPGGYGTLEEVCEAITWTQLRIHDKLCGLLNIGGYYDSLLGLFDQFVEEGFVRSEYRGIVLADTDPLRLLRAVLRAELGA